MRRASLAAAVLLALLIALLPTSPAAADDVYLTNGRVFEGVLARVEGDRVAIRLPHGLIRMPADKVDRIVEEDTPLATYLERRAGLAAQGEDADAAEWVELARWARQRGLASAFREAATTAARLDPGVEGLAPLMRDLDLHYDEGVDRWVSEDDLMRRRGLVRYDGAWVAPAERAAAEQRRAAAYARHVAAQRERQRDAALADMASALRTQAETRAREDARADSRGIPLGAVYYWPGVWSAPGGGHGGHGHGGRGGRGGRGDGGHDGHRGDDGGHHRGSTADRGDSHRGGFRASDWIPGRLNPGAASPPGSLISRSSGTSSRSSSDDR